MTTAPPRGYRRSHGGACPVQTFEEPTMTPSLAPRPWLPPVAATRIQSIGSAAAAHDAAGLQRWLGDLIADNQRIHDETCVNLNPATNRMNPRAEQMLAARLGSRPSLGYPGDKY